MVELNKKLIGQHLTLGLKITVLTIIQKNMMPLQQRVETTLVCDRPALLAC